MAHVLRSKSSREEELFDLHTQTSAQELLNLGTRAMSSLARGAPAQELFSRSIARPKSSRSAVCASELSGRLKCGR